jgi:Domain of unknown function (DUF6265)
MQLNEGKSMRYILLLFVFSLSISSISTISHLQDTTSIKELDWIVGCWKSSNSKFETREHWMPAAGNMMVGMSHTVSDGETIGYEYLRIEERDGKLVYIANPSGQEEASFYQSEISDKKMVFVNPDHDFPQRITYYLLNDGSIHARVEGEKNDKIDGFDIFMLRVDCLK